MNENKSKMFLDNDVYSGDGQLYYSENIQEEATANALDKFKESDKVSINVTPIREMTYKYNTGYGAYICEESLIENIETMPDSVTISGSFISPLDIGQTYEAFGEVNVYRGKKQLRVFKIKKVLPTNKRGIVSFLRSLNNVGVFSDLIYDEYGDKSLELIRTNPLKLLSLSPSLYEELVLDWQKQLLEIKDDQEILATLMGYGLRAFQAKQLFDEYKELVVSKIEENPYLLAKEVKGYSFVKCDTIARNVGFPPTSPLRISEGIVFTLETAKYEGHTCLPEDILLEKVSELLSVKMSVSEMRDAYKRHKDKVSFVYKYGNLSFNIKSSELVKSYNAYNNAKNKFEKERSKLAVIDIDKSIILSQFKELKHSNRIAIEDNTVYLKEMLDAEQRVAFKIAQLTRNEKPVKSLRIENILNDYLIKHGFELEAKQEEAVLKASSTIGGFMVINGSAGCGKTFSLKIALDLIQSTYATSSTFFESIILAPTGKATKVAEEATGMFASTIHKALRYNPTEGFFYNSNNYLPYDCIVLDESSMLDIELARSLFDAISPKTKVIFLGDVQQLASIGAGNVLKDLINCDKIKVVTLNVAKRQGADSGIIKNANRIIAGEMIKSELESKDSLVYKANDGVDCSNKIIKMVNKLLLTSSIAEIQVLCPQKGTVVGTDYLNFLIQESVNPENNEVRFVNKQVSVVLDGDRTSSKFDLFFKKGDKVINNRNDYDAIWYKKEGSKLVVDHESSGITNGETGVIVSISEGKELDGTKFKRIIVMYNDKYVIYKDDFSDLDHAYALTIHKSQGSQWKNVIIPIMFSNMIMLDRNLLYTGLTRSQKFSCIIGERKAIEHAVTNTRSVNRYTTLNKQLNKAI